MGWLGYLALTQVARVQFPVSETFFGHQELNILFRMSKWCIFFLLGAAGNRKNIASAGNRTRINCLEGSYADHYTTDAVLTLLLLSAQVPQPHSPAMCI